MFEMCFFKFWIISVSIKSSHRPFGSLQVVIGLFELSDVFVELILDAACLAEVVLQHGNLLVALRVLLLQLVLKSDMWGEKGQDRTGRDEDRQHILITCL